MLDTGGVDGGVKVVEQTSSPGGEFLQRGLGVLHVRDPLPMLSLELPQMRRLARWHLDEGSGLRCGRGRLQRGGAWARGSLVWAQHLVTAASMSYEPCSRPCLDLGWVVSPWAFPRVDLS